MNQQFPNEIKFGLIFKRRKWFLIVSSLIIFTISVVVAFVYPASYKSSATILIEEQEIPQNFVMSTITSYAEQRLQMINQRIMSFSQLHKLVEKFNLYPELKAKWTEEQIIGKMRDDIKMNTISAETMNHQTGRSEVTTIAFQVSYAGNDPQKVYQVASDLTTLYLDENVQVMTKQTKEASTFLEDEMNKVRQTLTDFDSRIKTFKEKHLHELPEYVQMNLQMVNESDRNIGILSERLRQLSERENYLMKQLSSLSPEIEFNTDQRRLDELQVQLVTLKSKFSDQYPDVIRTKAEIDRLEKHLAQSRKEIPDTKDIRPENPNYLTISSQLEGTRGELKETRNQIRSEQGKKAMYNKWIESTSAIEGEYNALMTEQANTKSKYNDLNKKLMEANVAHGLEKEQKGERFTLIEPAMFPEKPFKPNRIMILIMGLILSVAISASGVLALDYVTDTIIDPEALFKSTKIPVLGEISVIRNRHDLRQISIQKKILFAGMVITPVVGILIFHFFIMDLNVFWVRLIRKLML